MFVKKVLLNFMIISGLFSLGACKTTELVFYEHEPSKSFYQNYNIDVLEIKPFIDDDILFAVSLKGATHTKYFVWLGLYSEKKDAVVKIKKATLFKGENRMSSEYDAEIMLNHYDGNVGLYKNSSDTLKLFEIDSAFLSKLSGDGKNVYLKVFYEIDGNVGVMSYELKRRTEKHNVYPT